MVTGAGPEALLTHVDAVARRRGLRPGLMHAIARRRVPELRVAAVAEARVQATVEELLAALGAFSSWVTPHAWLSGAFLLDPHDLSSVYGGLRAWAQIVHSYLAGRGLSAAVVVGFDPHRLAAVACAARGPVVLANAATERARANTSRLWKLGLPRCVTWPLQRQGVETLGELLELPAGEVYARFGPDVAALQALFAEGPQLVMPLCARASESLSAGIAAEDVRVPAA